MGSLDNDQLAGNSLRTIIHFYDKAVKRNRLKVDKQSAFPHRTLKQRNNREPSRQTQLERSLKDSHTILGGVLCRASFKRAPRGLERPLIIFRYQRSINSQTPLWGFLKAEYKNDHKLRSIPLFSANGATIPLIWSFLGSAFVMDSTTTAVFLVLKFVFAVARKNHSFSSRQFNNMPRLTQRLNSRWLSGGGLLELVLEFLGTIGEVCGDFVFHRRAHLNGVTLMQGPPLMVHKPVSGSVVI